MKKKTSQLSSFNSSSFSGPLGVPAISGACESVAAYVRACREAGGQPDGQWRTADMCPAVECTGDGQVWDECGSGETQQCGSGVDGTGQEGVGRAGHFCVEGCYCPQGYRLHSAR
jgi:hypothetical protein